ncbi:MAG: hypothetical protein IJ786_00015 [Bacteroidaceae bacterium]|nr:hypothetical protein [Bacteroidaceae bacterium]
MPQDLVVVTGYTVNVREGPSLRSPRLEQNFGMGYFQVGKWVFPCLEERNGWFNINYPLKNPGWISGTLSKRTGTAPIDLQRIKHKYYQAQDGYVYLDKNAETGLILMEHHVEIGAYDDDDAIAYSDFWIGRQISPGVIAFFKSWQANEKDEHFDVFLKWFNETFISIHNAHDPEDGFGGGIGGGTNFEVMPCDLILRLFGEPLDTVDGELDCIYVTDDLLQ